jgi:two-component system, response regulator, stage 0 sporulation protein F
MNKTILVIDDDENLLHLLKLELSDRGYDVILASDVRSGIHILKEKNINLVILDIKMPRMDGIEALQKIICFKKELPVIIHSAYSHFKENYLTWSANDYVIKSSNIEVLLKSIERQFNNFI